MLSRNQLSAIRATALAVVAVVVATMGSTLGLSEIARATSSISDWERVEQTAGSPIIQSLGSGLAVTVTFDTSGGAANATSAYPPLKYITNVGGKIRFAFSSPVSNLRILYSHVDPSDTETVRTDQGLVDFRALASGGTLVAHTALAVTGSGGLGTLSSDGVINSTVTGGWSSGIAELEFSTPINYVEFEGTGYGGNLVSVELPKATVSAPATTSGTVGEAFSSGAPVAAQFLTGDLSYAVSSGTLPGGLSIDPTTGVISGTPTTATTQAVIVTANRSGGGSASSPSFSLVIAKGTQAISWSPSTSLTLADSGLTLAATLTTGDGTLSYVVESSGTTGCSVSGSTLTFESVGSGANGCEVRPEAGVTSNYNLKNDASTVTFDVSRGTFEISAPSSKVGTSSSGFSNVCTSSCDVSGFAAADEIRVVVGGQSGVALSGRVRLDAASFSGGLRLGDLVAVTGYNGNNVNNLDNANGYSEIAFEGTQLEVNRALEALQYKSPVGGGDETLSISASLARTTGGNPVAFYEDHYYQFVSATTTWTLAKAAAAASTFNGLTGYLATITSAGENTFIVEKTGGAAAWVGASDEYSQINTATGASTFADQAEAEGHWYWVTGPEAGTEFWDEHGNPSADGRISGQFQYWNNAINQSGWGAEPNNSGSPAIEHYLQLRVGTTGNWNDLPNSSTLAYVIEYGGLPDETALKQASTTFEVGAPTVPSQVSGVSVSAGNAQLTLSWTAPGTGGSAITDYVIEQSTDGGTTWTTVTDGTSTSTSYTVTGLTNGSSYSFRVSAKNAIGTGTASSTASGTPAVPAATSTSRNNDDDEPIVTPVVTPTVTRPTVRLPFPTPTPPRPTVLSAPVKTPTSVSTPVNRLVSRVGGVPAPVTTSMNGDDELSVSTSSLRLSLKMSQQASVSETPDANAELTIKPGAKAAVTATGLLPNTTLQVWLPNVTERELGRLSVNANGEIQGELGLSSNIGEDPLPVGRQTLQMTGYDVDGNQTVVEMPVNIAQGPPTPEPNRQEGALPELGTGQSLATSAGIPTPTTVSVLQEQNAVSVTGDGWGINMNIPAVSGTVQDDNGQPVIRLVQSSLASMSGSGMQPGTIASVWFFSEPTLMGTVAVADDGSFTLDVMVDAQFIPAGNHTVQVQGVGTDGFIKSVNMGVLVEEPAAQTTASSAMVMLWWALAAAAVIALLVVILVSRRRRQA